MPSPDDLDLSTLPDDADDELKRKNSTAEIHCHPNGKFVYVSNRGHDSIAAYRLDDDGRLTLIGIQPSLGKGPQNLAIIGDLLLCANMPGNNVAVFRINGESGGLTSVGKPVEILSPSCIMVLP